MSRIPSRSTVLFAVKAILAGAAATAAGGALAQATQGASSGTQIEEVVVTGYRQSLVMALDEKRAAAGAVDAIVAEDIADFPDLNLAESIQRIPGVSIARDAGEGRQISVRGLGPDFTRIRINGMEALTTTGGTDAAGGTNRGRGFDFNTFASELFNSITVRKTASADVEEGSLGATVDLNVARPFDYDRFTLVTGAQLGYDDLGEDTDPRGTFLISNTFADGRFGALLSVAYTERKLLDEGASTVRWQDGGAFESTPAGLPLSQDGIFRPRIPRYDIYGHEQERLGVTASLQFQPSEATLLTLDALYADFDAERSEIFLESPNFSSSLSQVDVREAEVRPDGVDADGAPVGSLVYGVFDDVDIRTEHRFDKLSTKFTQFTLDGTHNFSDAWSGHALVGRAESEHENPVQTTLLWDMTDIDGYSYDYRVDSRRPLISYGNADVTNPEAWTLTQIRLRPQFADNTFTNYLADLSWAASDALTFKGGAQLKKYEFETRDLRRVGGEGVSDEQAALARSQYSQPVHLGLGVPAGTTTRWVVPDLGAAAELFGFYDQTQFPLSDEVSLGNNFGVDEEDRSAFLQMDFRTELGSLPVRGNVGVRYVDTKQTSRGFTRDPSGVLSNIARHDYSNTLPSLNLVADVTDDFLIRFGASKVMARPGLGSLNPGASVQISGNNKTVGAGNPRLEPFKADAYDLSFEWYFARESLLGVALFYKDIASFVQTVRAGGDFSENPLGLDDSVAIAVCDAQLPTPFDPGNADDVSACLADWQFSLPRNTPGGSLKGFEVSYQQPFSFLPGAWSSFGAILNYTYVESQILYLNSDGTAAFNGEKQDLTGLSKNAANATLYFDNGTFSARVSAAYRDEYLTTAPGRNGNDVEGTAATTTVDFSSSWSLNDHLELTLEGLNLTDEFQDQWVDSQGDRLSYYHHTGRQYFLGARYKF